MLKAIQLGQQLTKKEMKEVKGGTLMSCHCIGSVGSWTGNYTLGRGEVWADIHAYCSSGHGWCNTVQN